MQLPKCEEGVNLQEVVYQTWYEEYLLSLKSYAFSMVMLVCDKLWKPQRKFIMKLGMRYVLFYQDLVSWLLNVKDCHKSALFSLHLSS